MQNVFLLFFPPLFTDPETYTDTYTHMQPLNSKRELKKKKKKTKKRELVGCNGASVVNCIRPFVLPVVEHIEMSGRQNKKKKVKVKESKERDYIHFHVNRCATMSLYVAVKAEGRKKGRNIPLSLIYVGLSVHAIYNMHVLSLCMTELVSEIYTHTHTRMCRIIVFPS